MNTSTPSASTVYGLHHKPGHRSHAPFLPHRIVSMGIAIWSLLLGIALVCPAILFMELFPVTPEAHYSVLKSMSRLGFVVLMSTIVGPLLEEVVYRGLFLQLLRRHATVWIAILLSSALFAATHFMKGGVIMSLSFSMGCLFAWMTVRTGSFYPGFLCHAVFDFAAVVFGRLFDINDKILAHPPGSTFPHPLTELFPAWWIVVSIAMAVISFIMLVREFARCERLRNPKVSVATA